MCLFVVVVVVDGRECGMRFSIASVHALFDRKRPAYLLRNYTHDARQTHAFSTHFQFELYLYLEFIANL